MVSQIWPTFVPTIPALLFILLVGLAAMVWYRPQVHIFERLALAYLVGSAFVTLTMFWLSVIGIGFEFKVLLPFLIVASIVSLAYALKKGILKDLIQKIPEQFHFNGPVIRLSIAVATVLILGVVCLLAVQHSITIPIIIGADAYGRQAPLVALANQQTVQTDAYALLQIPHPEYPLHLPLMGAFVLMFQSSSPSFFDANVNILSGFFYISLVMIFYFRIREQVQIPLVASGAAIVLATTPFILNASWMYSQHFPASVYAFAGVVYFYAWYNKDSDVSDLWLAGFLLGCFAWTRLDGLLFALAPLAVSSIVLIRMRLTCQTRIAWHFFLPYMVVAFAWPVYRHIRFAAYGQLAIFGNADLVLFAGNVMLIAAYFVIAAFITRVGWIKQHINQIILVLVILSIVAFVAITLWKGIQAENLTGLRLQILETDILLPQWGELAVMFLIVPFLLRQVIQRWYLMLVVLWSFMLWGIIYLWDLTNTWPQPNNFGGALGSANRSLLYIFPLVLFAVAYFLAPKVSGETVEAR